MSGVLTARMRLTLRRVPVDWSEMPLGCTNPSVIALEKRGLIETRLQPEQRSLLFAKWDWRLTPTGA